MMEKSKQPDRFYGCSSWDRYIYTSNLTVERDVHDDVRT